MGRKSHDKQDSHHAGQPWLPETQSSANKKIMLPLIIAHNYLKLKACVKISAIYYHQYIINKKK